MGNRLQRVVRDFDFNEAGKWLLLGVTVGIVGGVGAILFQLGLQAIKGYCLVHLAGVPIGYPGGEPSEFEFVLGAFTPWLVVLLPALGGLLAGLIVFRLAPEAEGHGTDAAIDAYHRRLGLIRPRVPLVKMVASIITLGSGGSGGREGPIAQIGAGFGSFLGQRLGLGTRTRRWLLAAGIGAGIGSIFRAPLAGALFAGEVLYSSTDVETEVLLPATVSSIVAYSVYSMVFGFGHVFSGAGVYGFHHPLELGPYLVLAVVVALAALVYVKAFYGIHALFKRLPVPREVRPMIGGALTGLLALGLVQVAGGPGHVIDVMSSGYGIIQDIILTDADSVALWVLLAVAGGKILTTSFSIGSGGSGGVFGPSMVIGAAVGAAVGKGFHLLLPGVVEHPTTFAIVGMAGFFAAAANTPISTVIMVSELTGNYQLLIPAMWVCTLAFLVGKRWSIFHNQVPSKLWSPAHFGEYNPDVFAEVKVGDVFRRQRKFVALTTDMSLQAIFDATSHTRQRLFPVADPAGRLAGAFRIDEITHALHDERRDPRSVTAADLLHQRPHAVRISDPVERAQRMLRSHHVEELLVVEDDAPDQVAGIITSADILLAYTRGLSRIQLGPDPNARAAE